jgi:hypothetical protein
MMNQGATSETNQSDIEKAIRSALEGSSLIFSGWDSFFCSESQDLQSDVDFFQPHSSTPLFQDISQAFESSLSVLGTSKKFIYSDSEVDQEAENFINTVQFHADLLKIQGVILAILFLFILLRLLSKIKMIIYTKQLQT